MLPLLITEGGRRLACTAVIILVVGFGGRIVLVRITVLSRITGADFPFGAIGYDPASVGTDEVGHAEGSFGWFELVKIDLVSYFGVLL